MIAHRVVQVSGLFISVLFGGLLFSLILTLNFLNFIGLEITKHPHVLASDLGENISKGLLFYIKVLNLCSRLKFMVSIWKNEDNKHLVGQSCC